LAHEYVLRRLFRILSSFASAQARPDSKAWRRSVIATGAAMAACGSVSGSWTGSGRGWAVWFLFRRKESSGAGPFRTAVRPLRLRPTLTGDFIISAVHQELPQGIARAGVSGGQGTAAPTRLRHIHLPGILDCLPYSAQSSVRGSSR